MRTGRLGDRAARVGRLVVIAAVATVAGDLARAGDEPRAQEGTAASRLAEEGRALFLREWAAGPTEHGGDGLGPVFNDSSCVACHNAGGPGGGGPNSKNVDIITALPNPMAVFDAVGADPAPPASRGLFDGLFGAIFQSDRPDEAVAPVMVEHRVSITGDGVPFGLGITTEEVVPATVPVAAIPRKPDRGPLIAAHAGFRTANSVVLHRFSTEPDYEGWRSNLIGLGGLVLPTPGHTRESLNFRAEAEMQSLQLRMQQRGGFFPTESATGDFSLIRSQRNPTALFGAGLIDRIPDSAIEAQAALRHEGFPGIAGRVAKGKDGRIGRFGWKAQTPTLEDFVLTACAVELGLEVPGHSQGGLPSKPEYRPEGLDLTADECAALTAYVRSLGKPGRTNADHPDVQAGERVFAAIGCAECHAPTLGEVEGIYSDLLVHDLGPMLGDVGQYGVFTPDSSEPEIEDAPEGPIAAVEGLPVPQAAPPAEAQLVQAPARIEDPLVVHVVTQAVDVPLPPGLMPSLPGDSAAAPRPADGPAGRQEWRTPPLWGLRDSGPYLHDGRADTIDEAIALHGGEAATIARDYFTLTPAERRQLQAFLKSLTAPEPPALVQAGE